MRCSVVMCTFNGERYLAPQLSSIVEQSRPPDEIIICDDASTDFTWRLLQDFRASTQIEVRLAQSRERRGVVKNFERAIELATGDLIFLADQDDVWDSGKIEAYERSFAIRPDVGLLFSDADLIDFKGEDLGERLWASPAIQFLGEMDPRTRDPYAFFEAQLSRNVVTGATIAFRSRFRELLLPFPASLSRDWYIHDGWITLLLAAAAEVLPVPYPFVEYRVHEGQNHGLRLTAQRTSVASLSSISYGERVRCRQLAGLSDLLHRLERMQAKFPPMYADLDLLREWVEHLQKRSEIANRRIPRRLSAVMGEVRSGGYRKYSSGYRSAVLDATGLTKVATRKAEDKTPGGAFGPS